MHVLDPGECLDPHVGEASGCLLGGCQLVFQGGDELFVLLLASNRSTVSSNSLPIWVREPL